jgi:site-specific DNA-cytosine methylase
MKVFSLFSGIGGFEIAATNLGHTIVGACEIDKYVDQFMQSTFQK